MASYKYEGERNDIIRGSSIGEKLICNAFNGPNRGDELKYGATNEILKFEAVMLKNN